jgi:hypothetical protein
MSSVREPAPVGTFPAPADACDDCRDSFTQCDWSGISEAAAHIAMGALGGGSPCDHGDYDAEDEAQAWRWLWQWQSRRVDTASNALMAIRRADRSGRYEYAEARPFDGAAPPKGSRWDTPRELAEAALVRLHGAIPSV